MDKKNVHALWTSKTHTHYGQAKHAHVMENHKKWVWYMAREMNKNNSL